MLILCASCKGYSDAWVPFGTLFHRFWPDCPYRRVLYADPAVPEIQMPGFEYLYAENTGPRGWVFKTLRTLEKFNDPTVAIFQEDFFMCYPAHTETIRKIDSWMQDSPYACCRLFPCPGANDETEVFPGIGTITLYAPYRASCQVAIWKRVDLIELCRRIINQGFGTIQDFEIQGSKLIDDYKLCGWIRGTTYHPSDWPVCYHCSAIAGGKWMQGAVKFCMEQGIPLSNKRGIVFADDAQLALLSGTYYEWLERCAKGETPSI